MTSAPDSPEPTELVHQALDDLAEAQRLGPELEEAARRVQSWLEAALPPLANRVLALAAELPASSDDRNLVLAEAKAHLDDEPALAFALSSMVELSATRFSLPMSGATQELLATLAERVAPQAEGLKIADEHLRQALERCWESPASRAHQRVRCLILEGADAETRARALSADLPEMLPVARALVRSDLDVDAQLDQLTTEHEALQEAIEAQQAREEAEKGDRKGKAPDKLDEPDPVHARVAKRRFTWLHFALALLIVGLFAWQYLWR